MAKVKFRDVVRETKEKVDRSNNPYEFYVAGDHMDTEDLTIRRKGRFATDDVGPAFIRVFHEGQVLYGSRRTYLKKIAVANFDGVTANTTFVLETKNENILRQRLIPFIMYTEKFTEWSVKKSKGSTNPYVLFSDLADYEFDLPPIEKQDELVELLWSMVEAKEAYQELLQQTDELVKARFIEMFGEPSTQMKTGKGILVRRLGDMIILGPQNGLYKPQKFYKADGSGTPIVRVDSFYDGHVSDFSLLKRLQCTKEEQKLYCLENGDFVFNRVNGSVEHVGKCALIQGIQETTIFESNVMRIRVNENMVNIWYLATYLCSDIVRSQIKGTAKIANQASINQEDIKNLLVPLPTIAQQKQYAAFVQQSDNSRFELEQAMKALESIYIKIISENLG